MEKSTTLRNRTVNNRTSQISLGLAATSLIITLVMSGFYIVDTTTGQSNLRSVLADLGLCEPLEDPVPFPTTSATKTPTPEASESATAGEDGATGSPGTEGSDGSPGAPGPTGTAGPAGECSFAVDLALIDGNLVPSQDNFYSLGSSSLRWKDLQLGPGTLYIEDPVSGLQVGVTVNDGSLLLDGADSLRIGNIRLTANGIESMDSNQDIRIGNLGDTGYVLMARGLKFPDGTIQTTASLQGPVGPIGPRGLQGVQGPQGPTGDPREPMAIGTQDGNESPPAVLDLSKQVFVFNDGRWLLPEAKEGTIVYFVLGRSASAEDIVIEVQNLRFIRDGRTVEQRDALWGPFSFARGEHMASLVSAVYTEGAWNMSGGELRR